MDCKIILNNVECVQLYSCAIFDGFFEHFFKFCPNFGFQIRYGFKWFIFTKMSKTPILSILWQQSAEPQKLCIENVLSAKFKYKIFRN